MIKENDSEGKEKLEQHHVVIECDPDVTSKKDTCIFFQTLSTNKPLLLAQESDKYPGEVAMMISFSPSFVEKPHGQGHLEVKFDERPEP